MRAAAQDDPREGDNGLLGSVLHVQEGLQLADQRLLGTCQLLLGKALVVQNLQAISSVARDDRDGCSRYRASKMSPLGTN